MIVKCEAGPVSLRTVEKRRRWYVRDVEEQERKVAVEEEDDWMGTS